MREREQNQTKQDRTRGLGCPCLRVAFIDNHSTPLVSYSWGFVFLRIYFPGLR
jgi:hypothetical protein